MKKQLFLILAMSLPSFAQTTYQLGTNNGGSTFVCSAASRYKITSPYQFNCNGVPLLDGSGNKVGSVQIENAGGWVQVHAPGIAEPNQDSVSKLAPDMNQFSTPNGGAGKVVFNFEITDANNNVFHGNVTAPWDNKLLCGGRGCIWYAPELLTTPVDGTLTISPGPLQ